MFLASLSGAAGGAQAAHTDEPDRDWLQELPHTFGRMTALEDLTLSKCLELSALPLSMTHLCRLQTLIIVKCPIGHAMHPGSHGGAHAVVHLAVQDGLRALARNRIQRPPW
jgi:hypothetical protein